MTSRENKTCYFILLKSIVIDWSLSIRLCNLVLELALSVTIINYMLLLPIIIQYRATTHSDLVVRAKSLRVDVKVVHNASVMNAIGVCGLQLYRYGETVSIPFFTDSWRPDSFYEKIQRNRNLGLHTLCLLGKGHARFKMTLISCQPLACL